MSTAVAVSGSPSRNSRSRRLAEYALSRAAAAGFTPTLVDLCELPSDDLLGRSRSPRIEGALAACTGADLLIVTTPVYRAAYSGLLKVFFDQFQPDALARAVAVPMATGAATAHALMLDHALRPLLASVGALVIPNGVYAVDAQFGADGPDPAITELIDRAVARAAAIASRR